MDRLLRNTLRAPTRMDLAERQVAELTKRVEKLERFVWLIGAIKPDGTLDMEVLADEAYHTPRERPDEPDHR